MFRMQTRILGNLLRISRCFDTYRRQNLKEIDLYPALHTVVSFVCRNPGCIQEDLVRRLCLDKTTVAHHLLKLEEKGFIERRVSEEDARCRLVYPTEKAMQVFPQMHLAYES